MKKWQQIIAGLAVGAAVLGVLVGPGLALAADDYGLGATAKVAGVPTDKNVQTIIGNVIGTALSMISVLFFALMLYAGIKWMLARGDSDEAKKALDTIIAAIIGMLVVLGSYAITNFVFGTLGQTNGGPTGGPKPGALSCVVRPDIASACSSATTKAACDSTIFEGVEVDWPSCDWDETSKKCSAVSINTVCGDDTDKATCEADNVCRFQ